MSPAICSPISTKQNGCPLVQVAGRTRSFHVLLTTFELLMGRQDRPLLSQVDWDLIVVDEAHRLKNAQSKLNSEMKLYSTKHRLLLTGVPTPVMVTQLLVMLHLHPRQLHSSLLHFCRAPC